MIKDLAAERAVLSALVQFGLDVYMELDFLTTDCFVDNQNQFLFDCISSILSEGREVGNITVTQIKDGKKADVVHDITFAFVAHAFMPETTIIQ